MCGDDVFEKQDQISFYDTLEDYLDNDEISPEEEAFMNGYNDSGYDLDEEEVE